MGGRDIAPGDFPLHRGAALTFAGFYAFIGGGAVTRSQVRRNERQAPLISVSAFLREVGRFLLKCKFWRGKVLEINGGG